MPDNDNQELILAAEECEPEQFSNLHRFSKSDDRLITKLIAHGPVLIRGGRGCGKSALMIEASRRIESDSGDSVLGVYLSLRHLELLRSQANEYERALCSVIAREVAKQAGRFGQEFNAAPSADSVQRALADLSMRLGRRIVLFFDDAAHIGREASLADFFDIFRTISGSTVSCKAAIYPGVTRFGTRFDVFNDATVIDVVRNEDLPGFGELFVEIMSLRYAALLPERVFSGELTRQGVASFLGQAVLGNMRAFIFACNKLGQMVQDQPVGLNALSDVLIDLASNHFWPLLDELKPKLGVYEPLIEPAKEVAAVLFDRCAQLQGRRSAIVHRDMVEQLAKPFEMLEYAGFISRREASRAMKKGGRGARFSVNLCNLLESLGGRLTRDVYEKWTNEKGHLERLDPVELNRGSELLRITMPTLDENAEIGILSMEIDGLAKSRAYPYGLTPTKLTVLKDAQIKTVGQLASASDEVLLALDGVGEATLTRFRNVVGQAIWM